MTFKRLFTLEEARTMLIRVRPALVRMRAAAAELRQMALDDRQAGQVMGGDGHLDIAPSGRDDEERFHQLRQRVRSTVAQLNRLGIEVKDPVQGLIDFPHELEGGEVVFLCFHLGEDTIRAWHRIEDGYAGRRVVEE